MGDQVIAPPSMPAAQPAEVPAWAAEPDVAAAPDSSREEAIAEVLRSALAQGHSDEALAGILRKVLAGASPQTALTEPDLALPVVAPELDDADAELAREAAVDTAVDLPVLPLAAADLTAVELPVVELPVVELPPVELPIAAPPVVELPVADLPAVPAPVADLPTVRQSDWAPVVTDVRVELFGPEPAARSSVSPTWHELASQSPLWADTTPHPPQADAPIWAEVARRDSATTDAERTPWSLFGGAAEAAAQVAPETAVNEIVPSEVVEPVVPEAVEAVLPEAADEPAADSAAPESVASPVVAEDVAVEDVAVEDVAVEDVAATPDAEQPLLEVGPLLARTASDPAPMSLDATTVMPPLSLLPPLPGTRGRGRPPVPPARLPLARPSVPTAAASAPLPAPAPAADEPRTVIAPAPSLRSLATVTRLPVATPVPSSESPELPESADRADAAQKAAEAPLDSRAESPVESPATASVEEPAEPSSEPSSEPSVDALVEPVAEPVVEPRNVEPRNVDPRSEIPAEPGDVVAQLELLGLPAGLLGDGFAEQVTVHGTYAALTRALGLRLPPAPEVPTGAGEVLFVVGPGVETLRAARSLAATLRLDPEQVQWATRGDLVGLAPEASRMATIDAAIDRRQAATGAGTVTIVAVDAPLRTDAYWMAQMLAIWSPVAVWAVVEATRKPEDLEPWLEDLSRVDALIVQDTDLSADPAAVLRRVVAPVALLDGVRATPHRWASLLCERLEGTQS